MESKFCSNCGTQISKESIFCSGCGYRIKEDKVKINNCSNCGFQNKSSEKFCTNCGTNLQDQPRKIEGKNLSTPKSINSSGKKKKKGCFKTIILIIAGFLAIVIIGSIILYNLGDTPDSKVQVETDLEVNRDNKVNSNNMSKTTTISVYNEPASLKKASLKMETIFMEADTTQLKLLLTDTSFKTYTGVYAEIEPYMAEYGKAFKKRKLLKMNDIFALYAFIDEEGNKYTVEFTSVNKDEWKLVRF
jgi:uncharacterized membrane protein YvbJ